MDGPDKPPQNAPEFITELYQSAISAHEAAVAAKRRYDNSRKNARYCKEVYDRAVRELLQQRLF